MRLVVTTMLCVSAVLSAALTAALPCEAQGRPQYGPAGDARTRAELLRLREAAWRSWFAGDSAGFRRVVPEELIAIDAAGSAWSDREGQIEASRAFATGGGTLRSLSFPRNEFQVYGDVAILYSSYEVVHSVGDATRSRKGRATEVFVKRRGRWIHTGWHVDQSG